MDFAVRGWGVVVASSPCSLHLPSFGRKICCRFLSLISFASNFLFRHAQYQCFSPPTMADPRLRLKTHKLTMNFAPTNSRDGGLTCAKRSKFALRLSSCCLLL